MNIKHGMTGTPEYHAWQAMINRCTNQNYEHFHCYGGRGISVCKQWTEFESFYRDMGPRQSAKHSLDRKDTNGNYEPDNCRWATKAEQMRNMRKNVFLERDGKRQTISEWAREIGISVATIGSRIKAGTPIDKVLSKEQIHLRFIEFDGRRMTLTQWAKERGLSVQTLSNRLNVYGWPVGRALNETAL